MSNVVIDETIHKRNGIIMDVEYKFAGVSGDGQLHNVLVAVSRPKYDLFASSLGRPTLSYEKFIKVLRPLMTGAYAVEDIPEAFYILDQDHSGTIDIQELANFMPMIVPNANPYLLLRHIQKIDKNSDMKLNLAEFTALVMQNIGPEIAAGRA